MIARGDEAEEEEEEEDVLLEAMGVGRSRVGGGQHGVWGNVGWNVGVVVGEEVCDVGQVLWVEGIPG